MPRSALFVIDIQHFLAGDPKTSVPHADKLKAAGDKILSTARSINDRYRSRNETSPFMIVFVQHEEPASSGALVKGSEPWKLVFNPRQGVDEEILVPKTHGELSSVQRPTHLPATKAFLGNTFESHPELVSTLQAEGVEEIIAFGIQSDCCVEKTSKGALAAGFPLTLLSGAHATYDLDGKTADQIQDEVDERLGAAGAKIVKWEAAIAKWETAFST